MQLCTQRCTTQYYGTSTAEATAFNKCVDSCQAKYGSSSSSTSGSGNQTESGQDVNTTDYCGSGYTLKGDACYPNSAEDSTSKSTSTSSSITIPETGLPDPSGGIKSILSGVVKWILGIFGFIGIIGFVIAGIMYLVSAGDDTLMKRAKNGMIFSIIGVVIGLAGVVVIQAINTMLNAGSAF